MEYYESVVYCFGEGPGEPVKIGYTTGLRGRFSTVATHTWRPMSIFWAWWGHQSQEECLKAAFRDRNIRNEWFCDEDDRIKHLLPNNMPESTTKGWPRKDEVFTALRAAGLYAHAFPGTRSYYSATDERLYPHFNEALKAEILAFVAPAGLVLTDDDFAPRDSRELDSVIAALRQRAAA